MVEGTERASFTTNDLVKLGQSPGPGSGGYDLLAYDSRKLGSRRRRFASGERDRQGPLTVTMIPRAYL